VRLRRLHVDGFGRLAERDFAFGPGLNVVVGPNEAGKSTLAAAIIASLYGLPRTQKERWRPWTGPLYATSLAYETADGAAWEVHRNYDKDSKGVRVYDGEGADAAARVGDGKSLSPGEAHLRIPLDVFVQTACVRQRSVALEGTSADAVSGALARALSGGPKEDAAIGALERLDLALRKHVGTQRATKNAPLKKLRDLEEQQRRRAADARAALEALAALREHIAAERDAHRRDAAASAELERRARSLRAAHVRARLAALKDYRDEMAALQSARAAYDDVADFPAERVSALDDAYHSWRSAESVTGAAARDAAEEALDDAQRRELDERRRDVGTLDENAFAALRAAAAQADAARAKSAAASNEAAAARREGDGGRALAGAVAAAALIATLAAVGVAIAHAWTWTAVAGVVAAVLAVAAFSRARSRAARRREADAMQHVADAALHDEHVAANTVARVLEALAVPSVGELVRRRERFTALVARETAARKCETRAAVARQASEAEAARFDALADALVPGVTGTREERRTVARQRASRRREREGLDASLAMLTMRRSDILHGDDDYALQAEYDASIASGVEPAAHDDPPTLRALERERAELDARAREAERRVASLEGELRAGEENVPDVAALDETLAATLADIGRLEAFQRATTLAYETVEYHKDEAHKAFARRLEEYSAGVLTTITAGRYGEIHLDPATLAIRVRVPETGMIEDLDRLSAGTRDQVALVVRFATARMFAEGLETPPLLLDDPFAFWDAARIDRCLPVLVHGAHAAQTILFTASAELADAASELGATRIDMQPAVVA
jgi:DNA repair exonuclease SbcCD ATPase subunit